jgi:phosphoribosyl 1,2-cyclic phosphate phosphodiesterase
MTGPLEFTILGSGSSGGVPRADGNWGDCDPADPREPAHALLHAGAP